MRIEKNEKKYINKCQALARDLTEHFRTDTLEALTKDLRSDMFYAAVDDTKQKVYGYLTLRRTNARAAEVTRMSVAHNKWRGEAAAALLARAAADARGKGARLLSIKLLDPETGYEPYAAMWEFYEKQGFTTVATITPFPGWEPDQPCAVMVKVL